MKVLRDFKAGNRQFRKGDDFPKDEYTPHTVETFIKHGWIEGYIGKMTKDTPKKMRVK